MNQDILDLWLAKLRSGNIEQTTGHLHLKDGSMCCLGILCSIAEAAGVVTKSIVPAQEAYRYDALSEFLPDSVMAWAGLEDTDPRPENDAAFSEMNDREESFLTIADAIEREYRT
jgi:hypothetical protein